MSDLYTSTYNPDVLSCLANLSNDEVFTPPSVVNAMLDMLPQELFSDPNATFLDPACKSGVFLREIAKRLLDGLVEKIPELQERIDHIFHKQLFGIGITELTSLLARRSVYCSKYPNSVYSVSRFDDASGKIRFKRIQHRWKNGRCEWCGASEDQFGEKKREGLETHAYEFIHTGKLEEMFGMKFDVIIGNPPYQLAVNEGGKGLGAIPIYQKFVQQALKLSPNYLTMIVPSRWFSGGVGLDSFRQQMLNDNHISKIVDFINSNDCFPGIDINGGVCYFLWDKAYSGMCNFTSINQNSTKTAMRALNEHDIFVRHNEAINIIHKVQRLKEESLSVLVSSQTPFGLNSDVRGQSIQFHGSIRLFSSKGISFIKREEVTRNSNWIDSYKVILPKVTTEHGGIPDREGKYKVLTPLRVIEGSEVCTQSYLVVGPFANQESAINAKKYIETKFVRFLLQQSLSSMNISKDKFRFVPIQSFNSALTDKELYAKYNLSADEIAFIESMIKPME